jgi:AraC-like DNA-binding protein
MKMETLFAFDKVNYRDCQNGYRGTRNQEYYSGDYTIDAGAVIDVRAERKAVGSYSIIRLRSRTTLHFRRTLSHIREDGTDVAVLWFVKRGRLCIAHQCGHTVAKVGEFAITKSMTPFTIECQPDDEGLHEVLHVIVPAHAFRRLVPREVRTGFCTSAATRDFAIAERILTDVFEDTGDLKEQVSTLLVDSALTVLSEAITDRHSDLPGRQSVSDKRLQDVLKYIDVHLSDPKLSVSTVAAGCGISTRYLSYLLNLHGTPFTTLIWDKRLKAASQWLASAQPRDACISEIAYRSGFKSPAHFSRMFKRAYEMSPRQYRAARMTAPAPAARREPPSLVVDTSKMPH